MNRQFFWGDGNGFLLTFRREEGSAPFIDLGSRPLVVIQDTIPLCMVSACKVFLLSSSLGIILIPILSLKLLNLALDLPKRRGSAGCACF